MLELVRHQLHYHALGLELVVARRVDTDLSLIHI